MTTEIRDFGDKKTIVVYTDNREVATSLGKYKSCFKIVPYKQEQFSKKKVALAGMDYYFPKKQLKGLLRKFGLPVQTLPRSGVLQI